MAPAGLRALTPISLAALERDVPLLERADRKYILRDAELDSLLAGVAATHQVLEIDQRRVFSYRTVYYDTPDLLTFREHRTGRRRRFKVRLRRYLDSGLSMLELKLRGVRGRTLKHVLPYEGGPTLDDHALAFARETLWTGYGRELPALLLPTLTVNCRRITLASPELCERLTCDVAVDFGAARLAPGYSIVESKSAGPRATADGVLRALGARPAERCSKYCLGLALARPGLRVNEMLPLMRRYFEPTGVRTP